MTPKVSRRAQRCLLVMGLLLTQLTYTKPEFLMMMKKKICGKQPIRPRSAQPRTRSLLVSGFTEAQCSAEYSFAVVGGLWPVASALSLSFGSAWNALGG